MSNRVSINDVGPRDGLQNQPKILTVAERLQLIEKIAEAGVGNIEVGSFVSPKAVPAMAGTDQIVSTLAASTKQGFTPIALIPNMKGYELAQAAGAKALSMVLYGSEGMAQKNVRMSRMQAEHVTEDILGRAREDGIDIIATISVAFECPFDGPVDPDLVIAIAKKFAKLGAKQIVIADTIGAAGPDQVSALCSKLVSALGSEPLICHFHDTRAMGLANVYAALDAGIRSFDASIAGLGGCPFAPGATGNVATEDVVMMAEQMGYDTGVDLDKLMLASDLAEELTGSAPGGRAKVWLKRALEKKRLAAA